VPKCLGANGDDTPDGTGSSVRSTRAATEGFLNQLRQAVWSVNPSLSVTPRTMRDVYDHSLARTSFTS
jgi:putative ABC transport system permease protein